MLSLFEILAKPRVGMKWLMGVAAVTVVMVASSRFVTGQVGNPEITKWQCGNNGAVSLTYDDGSVI
jgi:hypothetical protein